MGKEQLTVEANQPVDSVVGNIIETIARQGKGFTLGLMGDEPTKKVEITICEELKPKDEFLPPAAYRAHVLTETDSLIRFAAKYGTTDKSVVYVGTDGAVLVIDESVEKGSRETIKLDLPLSDDFNEWSAVFNKHRDHKELLQFLREHEDNLVEPGVLVVMSSIKATSTVNYESDLKDDGKTIGMVFKTQAGEDLKRFPKQFGISIPVLRADEGDVKLWKAATVNLTIEMPDHPTQKPTFTLFCPEVRNIHRRRMSEEAQRLRDALETWLVVEGYYGTKPHEITR